MRLRRSGAGVLRRRRRWRRKKRRRRRWYTAAKEEVVEEYVEEAKEEEKGHQVRVRWGKEGLRRRNSRHSEKWKEKQRSRVYWLTERRDWGTDNGSCITGRTEENYTRFIMMVKESQKIQVMQCERWWGWKKLPGKDRAIKRVSWKIRRRGSENERCVEDDGKREGEYTELIPRKEL